MDLEWFFPNNLNKAPLTLTVDFAFFSVLLYNLSELLAANDCYRFKIAIFLSEINGFNNVYNLFAGIIEKFLARLNRLIPDGLIILR